MPIDRLVLIIVCVIAAAGATVWLIATLGAALTVPFGWLLVIPVALIAYVLIRIILERVGNREDDHYDGMKH